MQRKFGVGSYPTVMLLDASGAEFDRLEGYLPAQRFLEKLHASLSDPESLGNLKVRETAEPANLELRQKLGEVLFRRAAYQDAQSRFRKIAADDPENRSRVVDSALFYLALCQASVRDTDGALQSLDRLRRVYPSSALTPKASLLEGEILLRVGRKDAARSRIEDFLRRYPEHRLVEQAKQLLAEI
jgi:TolA-binding protein